MGPQNGLWMFLILSLVSVPLAFAQEFTECCPPGTALAGTNNCTDGSPIRVNCTRYMVDPEKDPIDRYTINPNTSELTFIHGGPPISFDNYCTNTNETKQTAIICFSAEEMKDPPTWRSSMLGCLFIVSSCFLLLTLCIYAYLPELRDIQDKSMMCFMISLMVGYNLLAFANLKFYGTSFDYLCIPIAFVMYYSLLTAFFWLNIVSFNIWRCVWFRRFSMSDDSLFAIFCVMGWGIPTCFLIAALTTHHMDGTHLKPGFADHLCWFPGGTGIWVYFLGPLTFLLILNVCYLSMTGWRLWQCVTENNPFRLRTLKTRCILYVKLMFVMGITWIFEVMQSIGGWESDNIWLPVDILNALQGFIIFLLLVAYRTKVKILLAKRRPCGITFPKSWALQVDEESEEVYPEEVELSRS